MATCSGPSFTAIDPTPATGKVLLKLDMSKLQPFVQRTRKFQQPGSTSIALNKIYQNSPSSIFGSLSANGQVYLLNPNGFVFGATSKVNVAGLVASSLGLTGGDDEFAQGLLSQIALKNKQSALSSDKRVYVTDASGNPVLDANGKPQPVEISIQPGAQITAADGGRPAIGSA